MSEENLFPLSSKRSTCAVDSQKPESKCWKFLSIRQKPTDPHPLKKEHFEKPQPNIGEEIAKGINKVQEKEGIFG